jgi:hypothetical protein
MAIKTFTTGEVLTAADTNTYLANSGLVYITQASATSGSTLSVNNCFSSTYSNYRILVDNFQPATAGRALYLRMRVGGSDATGTDYYSAFSGIYTDGTSSNTSASAFGAAEIGIYNSANTVPFCSSSIDMFGPNRAERTYMTINAILYNGQFGSRVGLAEHNLQTAYTGFTLSPSGGDFLNVRVWVYGYRNS